jgi:hypothetical protein
MNRSDAEHKGGEERTEESHDGEAEQGRTEWISSSNCIRCVGAVGDSSFGWSAGTSDVPFLRDVPFTFGREQRLIV